MIEGVMETVQAARKADSKLFVMEILEWKLKLNNKVQALQNKKKYEKLDSHDRKALADAKANVICLNNVLIKAMKYYEDMPIHLMIDLEEE